MIGSDWEQFFAAATRIFWQGGDPYAIPWFYGPPWLVFILLPFAWIPGTLAPLLPIGALLFAAYQKRKPYLIALVGLSFPFIALTLYANIDWLVLLGVVIRGPFGVVLDSCKPQVGLFAPVADLRERSWKQRLLLVTPLLLLVLISTLLFPDWLSRMVRTDIIDSARNFSLFPYSLVIVPFALWLCWKRGDPLWGCLATLCLTPYFYIHSLVPLMFLVADKNWKWGLVFTIATWVLVGMIILKIIPLSL